MAASFDHARPARPAPSAPLFWRVSGVVFSVMTGLGILLVAVAQGDLLAPFLVFDAPHNVLHAALAAGGVALGFGGVAPILAKRAALWVGATLVVVGVVGVLSADLFGLGRPVGLHLEAGENALHLTVGAWGAYVGLRA